MFIDNLCWSVFNLLFIGYFVEYVHLTVEVVGRNLLSSENSFPGSSLCNQVQSSSVCNAFV